MKRRSRPSTVRPRPSFPAAAAAVASICDALAAKGVKSHPLAVSHAFHSPLIEPILDRLEAEAAKATFKTPRAHIISNVTGRRIEAELLASPRYWRRHARDAVRFADGLRELAEMKIDICLELGPHPALACLCGHGLRGWRSARLADPAARRR